MESLGIVVGDEIFETVGRSHGDGTRLQNIILVASYYYILLERFLCGIDDRIIVDSFKYPSYPRQNLCT